MILALCSLLLATAPAVALPVAAPGGWAVMAQVLPQETSSPSAAPAAHAASKSAEYALREVASADLEEFSGGSTLLLAVVIAVVIVAVAALLIWVVRW
jgi:hypothetical protein